MSATAKRALRIGGKILAWTLGGIVMLVLVALATIFIGVRTDAGARLIVRIGLGVADKYLAAKITVGRLHTDLLHGLELDDVEMRDIDGELAAHIDKLKVKFSLVPLFHSTLHITKVDIIGAKGRARSLHNGNVNFADVLRPTTPQPPAPNSPASKFRVQIDDVHAEVDGLYEPPPEVKIPKLEGHILVAGSVGIGGGDVKVKVDSLDVHLVGPAPGDVHAQGGLDVKGVDVTFDPTRVSVDFTAKMAHAYFAQPELRGAYHLDGEGRGPLTALDLKAVLTTPSQPIRVEGQLRITTPFGWSGHVLTRDLDPELVLAYVPHAKVWLDAKGESNGPDITLAIAHAQVETKSNRVHASGKLDIDKGIHAALGVDLDLRRLDELRGPGVPPLAGSLVGHAKVDYAPASLRLDTKLDGKNLVLPGVRVRELSVQGKTTNLSGHLAIRASDVIAKAISLSSARLMFDGDTRQFQLRASAAGDSDTSLELGITGTPRYEEGRIPAGIATVVSALEVDRKGERWRVDPGAKITYDHGLRIEGLRARSQRQSLAIDGTFQPTTRRVDAEVRAVGLDLRRVVSLLAPADKVPASQLDLSLSAHGTVDRPKIDLSVAGTITRVVERPDEQVHLKLDAHVDPTQVSANLSSETGAGSVTLALRGPYVTSAKALLRSTAPLSVKIDTKLGSLAKLYSTIGFKPHPALAALDGTFGFSADLSGTGHAPTLQLALSGDGVHYGTVQNAALRAKILFTNDDLKSTTTFSLGADAQGKPTGEVTVHANMPVAIAMVLGTGSLAQKLSGVTPLDSWVKVNGLALGALPYAAMGVRRPVDAGTLDAELHLTGRIDAPVLHVDVTGKDIVRGAVNGIAFDAAVDSAKRTTQLVAHARVQGSPLANAKATMGFDIGMILSAVKVAGATLDGNVDLPGFDLTKLGALIPGLAGQLHGSVVAKGRLNMPSAVGDLQVDGFQVGSIKMDAFAVHGSYGEHGLKAELKAHEPTGGFLDGAIALVGQKIDATLRAHTFALDFRSEGESIPIRMLRGVIDAQVTAKGPLAAPSVAGHFAYTKGALGLTADPREISDLNLQLSLDATDLKLEKLTGKLGPGKFEVTGGAKLDHLLPTSVDLVLHTKQLPAVENPISVAVDSKITVHGERKDGALSGTIRIDNGSARLPTLTNVRDLQSTSALKDVVYVDERGRAAILRRKREAGGPPLQLTIETKLPGPFHVRSKELDVDLRGDLSATVHGEDFRLRGVVESFIGGHLQLFGKRYDIDQVRVSFDGGKKINPFIYVKLSRQLIAALITVEVDGTAEKPHLQLTAAPPIYSDSQIIQAILGGDPGEGTTDRGLDQKVTGAISGLVVGAIKDQLAPQLPIDVIKIDVGDSSTAGYTGIAQTRLEIGKYLTNSIYVSYVHQFGALQIGTQVLSANLGTFEYRFKRHYALDLTIGDAPEGRADLFWSIRF